MLCCMFFSVYSERAQSTLDVGLNSVTLTKNHLTANFSFNSGKLFPAWHSLRPKDMSLLGDRLSRVAITESHQGTTKWGTKPSQMLETQEVDTSGNELSSLAGIGLCSEDIQLDNNNDYQAETYTFFPRSLWWLVGEFCRETPCFGPEVSSNNILFREADIINDIAEKLLFWVENSKGARNCLIAGAGWIIWIIVCVFVEKFLHRLHFFLCNFLA